MLRTARWLGWFVIAVLVAAAAYELALALGAGSLGREPGEGVAGSGVVEGVALLAMLAGVAVGLFHTARPWRQTALLAPAAAAFLVAFFFTYDPYYAPDAHRFSDGGAVAGHWIVIVAALALFVGILTALVPRIGAALSSAVVLLVVLTTVFAGDGH